MLNGYTKIMFVKGDFKMTSNNGSSHKSLIIAVLLLSGLMINADDEPPKEYKGMLLKEDAKIDIAYVRPGVDWKKFKTVYFRKLDVTAEAKDASPDNKSRSNRRMRESWIIPDKDIELIKTEFARYMEETLTKAGIKVVSEINPDTLIIVPTIIDIYLAAPIEKSRKNYTSRGGTYTEGAGSMTIGATFADGSDMHVIAYAEDNRYPSSWWQKNTRQSNLSEMRRLFRYWGKNLGKALNKVQAE